MSDDNHDEQDDKITVLFPDGGDEKPADDGDPVTDEESDDGQPAEDGASGGSAETEQTAEDDTVVHLDFDKKADVDKPPRPVGEADAGRSDAVEAALEGPNPKYEVFQRMIEEGMVMVTLDTRVEDVSVPPKYEGLPELRLNFSHMFHIDDFDYDTSGVRASLSFEGTRHFCDVPWEAVFMLYSHESGDVVVFEPPTAQE